MQEDRKSTQRERILEGMIDVAACDGYASASIARVIAVAGVSRPTFYEYFTDKDDCFLAATGAANERLLAEVEQALATRPAEHAAATVVDALTSFATSQPATARFLMTETMAGGLRSLNARFAGIDRIGEAVEGAYRRLAPTVAVPDLSPRIMTGGIFRLLSARLRRDDPELDGLARELATWLDGYRQPLGEHRWRTLARLPPPLPSARAAPLLPPMALPARRGGANAAEVAENQRQRIIFAAAELATEDGYRAATIAEITRRAGVDAHTLHQLFADKQAVYAAVHELYFRHLMTATAGAYFVAGSWPERVWSAGAAFIQTFEQNPTLAHIGFVEAYSAGPSAERRLDEFLIAFTVFLQDGYELAAPGQRPSSVALEAIATTNFEMARHQVRSRQAPQLAGLLPHVIHICLAPFLGATETNRLIDRQLTAGRRSA